MYLHNNYLRFLLLCFKCIIVDGWSFPNYCKLICCIRATAILLLVWPPNVGHRFRWVSNRTKSTTTTNAASNNHHLHIVVVGRRTRRHHRLLMVTAGARTWRPSRRANRRRTAIRLIVVRQRRRGHLGNGGCRLLMMRHQFDGPTRQKFARLMFVRRRCFVGRVVAATAKVRRKSCVGRKGVAEPGHVVVVAVQLWVQPLAGLRNERRLLEEQLGCQSVIESVMWLGWDFLLLCWTTGVVEELGGSLERIAGRRRRQLVRVDEMRMLNRGRWMMGLTTFDESCKGSARVQQRGRRCGAFVFVVQNGIGSGDGYVIVLEAIVVESKVIWCEPDWR